MDSKLDPPDQLMIATRTWPYGTVLACTVLDVIPWKTGTHPYATVVESGGEGFIMSDAEHDVEPRKGDRVRIQFMQGGPTGGFWKIIARVE